MKTIEINLYEFTELTEEKQNNVLYELHDINVRDDWWENVYRDAKLAGVTIKSFSWGRDAEINIHVDNLLITAIYITESWGEECLGVSASYDYLRDSNDIAYIVELEEMFLDELEQELEYLMTPEAVKRFIIFNECLFTDDGKLYNA